MSTLDVQLSFSRATSLIGGATGSFPYQTATSSTVFVPIGANGTILQSNGTTATWVSGTTLSGGTSTQVANALTFANGGTGDASGTTFNGSAARTISYNSIGAPAAGILSTTSARVINGIRSLDSRSLNDTPGDRTAGFYVDFKTNTTNGLVDGGTYNGVMTFRSYGESNSDLTGGQVKQIAYTENNNLWHRLSTNSSTWGTWYKILDTLNSTTAHVNLANNVLTVGQPANATYFLTFVDANNAAATTEALYTTSSFTINPNTGATTINGDIIQNGITGSTGRNLILRGGTGASSEGAQLIMGYGNNTSSAITGQANNTWNLDVASGSANNNFRVFRQNNAGATVIAWEVEEQTGGSRFWGIGVGTTASNTQGELRATNEITAYFASDARLKENVQIIEDPITIVNQIRGVRFDWTDEHIARRGGEDGYFVRKHDIGVIAQEIEAVLPELVATREDGFKAVKYEKIVPLLIEVVKAQQRQINQIQEELNKLASK